MTKLVSSFDPVKDNILNYSAFIKDQPDLHDRLSKHRAWYAINDKGSWRFGNSKIIGYADLTPEAYLSEDHDGRQTEATLQKWFVQVEPRDPLHDELWEALAEFLAGYGKKPSKLTRINVPISKVDTDKEIRADAIGELIFEVAKTLDNKRIKAVRKRLKTLV